MFKRSRVSMGALVALAAMAGVAASAAPEGRHFLLSDGARQPGVIRFLSQTIELADDAKSTWVTVTKVGKFWDPRYGDFEITPKMLTEMVANFDKNVLGQDVFVDVAHAHSNGAAAQFLKLAVEGGKLRALVKWSEFGVDSVKKKFFKYFSAEFHEDWRDNEKGDAHGCVLLGAGLTIRPVIKGMDGVDPKQLSSTNDPDADVRFLVSPHLLKQLTETDMNKHLKVLLARLIALGFTDMTAKPFTDLAEKQLEAVKDDEAKCLALVEVFATTADAAMKQIKAAGGDGKTVTITLAAPETTDVAGEVAKQLAARETATAQAQTSLQAKHKLLSDTIKEGDKTLTEEGVKKFADDFAPMITAVTSDDQVKHLGGLAVKQAQQLSAAQKLAGLGYNPASGSVHISVDSSNSIKALQATIDTRLGFVETDARRFDRTGGKLLAANKEFTEKALAQFDAEHGQRLDREHKALAAGTGSISDVAVPAIAERTVLREALYNLNSLNFVNVGTAPFANVITIPYSYRDTTAAGMSALRRYEAQAIRRAGVIQTTEEARPIPQKLAFLISSELQLLMGASAIDFDPISENIRNIIRIVGEDTEAINMNEIVNAADEYSVTTITDVLTAQVQGTNTVFVTTKFPVVKPRKVYDLKGVQVGITVNPLVVTLNAVARNEYLAPADGSALGAGTYYIMDYNLGELRFVTEAGVPVVPTAAWVLSVAYSYSTNRSMFDTDAVVSESIGDRYDRLLVAIGNRKVSVGTDRYYDPNMVLMSNAIDNSLSQATSFMASGARNGSGLNADGSVGITKGMGTFNPKAPGLQLADTRIIVGERGNTRFRMVKPFAMNPIEQARDSNGKFTDQRESFGTQFVVSHTPTQIKGSCSSIILFSTAGRVARVA